MHGYYINLDRRPDRKQHFENNIKNHLYFKDIERLKAIEHNDGALGCAYSHLLALNMAKKNYGNMDFIAVFEDDFLIMNENNFNLFEAAFEKIQTSDEWDIIVLTPRGVPKNIESNILTQNGFKQILDNQTTTGYIIKMSFVDILIQNLKDSIENQNKGVIKDICACDQYWKKLQTEHRFYYYNYIFAGQLIGWSDVECRNVNYNARFVNQK